MLHIPSRNYHKNGQTCKNCPRLEKNKTEERKKSKTESSIIKRSRIIQSTLSVNNEKNAKTLVAKNDLDYEYRQAK